MVLTCDPLGFPLLRRRCSLPAGVLGSLEASRLAGDRVRTFSQTSRTSACEVTVFWQSPSLIVVPSAAVLLSALCAVAALLARWCSQQCCLGAPNLVAVGAQGAANRDFPPAPLFPSRLSRCSSLGDSLWISACQAAAGQPRLLLLNTGGSSVLQPSVSERPPGDDAVAADEHLAEHSHGRFGLGV